MAGITGMGLTFNLPNFVGELFEVTPSDTPFLSSIGGLTGGKEALAPIFQWQGYDLRAAAQNTAVEGAPAPTAQERVRFNVFNVVEIHQEAIKVSYTKQAATGLRSGQNIDGTNPVGDELSFQVQAMLKQIARDVEYGFINGTLVNPTDNTTARKTQGLLGAITTNVVVAPDGDAGTGGLQPSDLTSDLVDQLLQSVFDNGGIKESETATIVVNSAQKRKLTKAYLTSGNYREQSRNVGGVNYTTIETDFGMLNVQLNRYMPQDTLLVASLDECAPVFLPIPDKGFLFVEQLGKTGASLDYQIYGEIGLEYGNEKAHGKLTNLKTT